jgi:ribosomal 30S subunit maturation factor RimM
VLVDGVPATITLMRRVGGGRRAIRLDRPVERGAELAIPLSDLPALEPDAYYAFELVGLAIVDREGAALGTVADVHPGAANDNLELDGGMLVPLIEDAIVVVDLDGGRIVVNRDFIA